MSGRADPSVAQLARSLAATDIVSQALAGMTRTDQAQVRVTIAPQLPPVRLPLEAAARVVRSLIKNALHASTEQQPVAVTVDAVDQMVRIRVHDDGIGMTPEILARAGEPFFTTRPAGSGFGLGLFLVRTFANQWQGRFEIASAPQHGTTATLHLPIGTS